MDEQTSSDGGMVDQARFLALHPEQMVKYVEDYVSGMEDSNKWDIAALALGLAPGGILVPTALSSWCSGEGEKARMAEFMQGMVQGNADIRELLAERFGPSASVNGEDLAKLLAGSAMCSECNDRSTLEVAKNAVGTVAGIGAGALVPGGFLVAMPAQLLTNIGTDAALNYCFDNPDHLAGLKVLQGVDGMRPKDEAGAPIPVMDEKAMQAFLVLMHGSKDTLAELARDLGRPQGSDLTDTQFVMQELMEHIGGRASEKLGGPPVKTHLDALSDETLGKIDMLSRVDMHMMPVDAHDEETLGQHFCKALKENGGTATLAKLGLCSLAEVEREQLLQAPAQALSSVQQEAARLRGNGVVAAAQQYPGMLPPGFPPSGLPLRMPQDNSASVEFQQAT